MSANRPPHRRQFHITRAIAAGEHVVRAWIDPPTVRFGLDSDGWHPPLPECEMGLEGDDPGQREISPEALELTDLDAATRVTYRGLASERDIGEIEARWNARFDRAGRAARPLPASRTGVAMSERG